MQRLVGWLVACAWICGKKMKERKKERESDLSPWEMKKTNFFANYFIQKLSSLPEYYLHLAAAAFFFLVSLSSEQTVFLLMSAAAATPPTTAAATTNRGVAVFLRFKPIFYYFFLLCLFLSLSLSMMNFNVLFHPNRFIDTFCSPGSVVQLFKEFIQLTLILA